MAKDNQNEDGEGEALSPRLPWDVRLRSLKSSRQTMARLVRSWARGEISERDAKTGAWLLSMHLAYLRASTEEELEQRLQTMEKKLSEIERGRHGIQAAS